MNNSSYIFIDNKERIEGIYCRCDGGLEKCGFILNYYYKNINKVRKLIDLGNIYLLGKKIRPDKLIAHNFKYCERQKDVTLAYYRDGNLKKKKYIFKNRQEFWKFIKRKQKVNEFYLYDIKARNWFYLHKKVKLEFVLLEDYLKKENKVIVVKKCEDKLIKKYLILEKKIDLKNFNDVYESLEDAYYEFYYLISTKDGLLNMIDVLTNYEDEFMENNEKTLYELAKDLKNDLYSYMIKNENNSD